MGRTESVDVSCASSSRLMIFIKIDGVSKSLCDHLRKVFCRAFADTSPKRNATVGEMVTSQCNSYPSTKITTAVTAVTAVNATNKNPTTRCNIISPSFSFSFGISINVVIFVILFRLVVNYSNSRV